MPHSSSHLVLGHLMLLLSISSFYASNAQTAAGSADLTELLKAAFPIGEDVLSQTDFPTKRMPANTPEGWNMCDYSCMTNFEGAVKAGRATKGVLDVDVIYKPLPNVTSDMIIWFFNNVHQEVLFTDAANKTSVMPMYLLFQPVDHLFHTAKPAGSVRVGTQFTWCELPLTGCKHNALSASEPWFCPANRTGFIRSDPIAKWAGLMHTKGVFLVTHFNSSMIQFVARRSNPLFGGDGTRTVATTRHTWSDSEEGLLLRSQQWLGLMASGSHTKYDTSLLAPAANGLIKDYYLGAARNVPSGNVSATGYMAALHYLQEYGGLHNWLPTVYNSRPRG